MPIPEDMRLSDIDALQEALKREHVDLPNLMSLTYEGGPGITGGQAKWDQLEALRGLSMLRRLFPETVDSIVDIDFFKKHPQGPRARLFNAARSLQFRPGFDDPTHQMILDMEPHAPMHSGSRFFAKIPSENIGQIRQHAPQVLAQALLKRLSMETPEVHEKMLDAVMSKDDMMKVQRAMIDYKPQVDTMPDFIGSSIRSSQLKRRLASLYAPDISRFSGGAYSDRGYMFADQAPPTAFEDEREFREFVNTDPEERSRRGMSWTSGHQLFDDFEKVSRNHGMSEAIDRLDSLNSEAYWENKSGFGPSQHFSAKTARNPTNVAIQQLLNEAIGPGEGQMRGSVGVGPVAGIAALAAIPLLAGLLPGGARKYADAALMGGNVAGVPGALVGAGVEGVRDLFD
jgi:hypothetical protein